MRRDGIGLGEMRLDRIGLNWIGSDGMRWDAARKVSLLLFFIESLDSKRMFKRDLFNLYSGVLVAVVTVKAYLSATI